MELLKQFKNLNYTFLYVCTIVTNNLPFKAQKDIIFLASILLCKA